MSKATDVATKVLKDADEGRQVENTDVMYLRMIVALEEKSLLPAELARLVLAREGEPPAKVQSADQG
jgi:hypothetical protein